MSQMDFDSPRWHARLAELCRRHGVPGACMAVNVRGQLHEVAVGVVDVSAGTPMTNDAMFPIGSITKVYTATVVMRLVADGLVSLDTPVCEILPELRLADPEAARRITVRHLLSHTSGMENGTFPEVGSDDDCLARYVATCAELGQLHPVGTLGSYCHAGYLVAGRIVERLTGKVWETAVHEHLLDPLGLRHTAVRTDLVDPARRVPGHRERGDGRPPVPLRWDTPRAMGPGSGFSATAGDLAAFAAAHLSGSGTVLAPATVQAMREPQAPIPCAWSDGYRGLGWRVYPAQAGVVFGHGGELPGLLTYVYATDNPPLVIALCSNGGDGMALRSDVRDDFAALAGLAPRRFTAPENPPEVDIEPFLGTYRCSPAEARLERDGTGIWLRPRFHSNTSVFLPRPTRLVPVSETLFAGYESDGRYPIPVTFHTLADGSRYIYARERTLRRVAVMGAPVEGV